MDEILLWEDDKTLMTDEFFISEDVKTLMTDFKEQDYVLKIKRRWLAGLPLTKDERKLLRLKSKTNRTLPESFLREDDVFYETVKNFVQSSINNFKEVYEHHLFCNDMLPLNLQHDVRSFLRLLDNMTNECLCNVAGILTNGSVKYENIRCKMKKVIKDHLQKRIPSQNVDLYEKLSPLLKDPRSYRRNPVNILEYKSQSYEASVVKLLNGLGDLPQHALVAMERKLKGIQGHIPQIKNSKRHRDVLISNVRRICMKMLSKIGKGDEVREPLNKAMVVASLCFKLILGYRYVIEFRKFPPEVEALQMEIAKAIWFLDRRINLRFTVVKKLQLLVDPVNTVTKRSLRSAVRNLLMECLFECSDMDNVPEWLMEVLLVINKESRSAPLQCFSTEDIEEEVECILNLGAHTKQIVWNLSPQHEFDHEFADSYMEDLEESDDEEDSFSDEINIKPPFNSSLYSNEAHNQYESIAESISANFTTKSRNADDYCSPIMAQKTDLKAEPNPMHITCKNSVESSGHDFFSSIVQAKVPNSPTSMDGNQHSIHNTRGFGLTSSSTLKMTKTPCARFSPDIFNGHSSMKQESKVYSDPNFSCWDIVDKKEKDKKPLLAIEGASDDTSLFVYRLLGHMLFEFAQQTKGLQLDLDDVAYLRCGKANRNKDRVVDKSSCYKDGSSSVVIQLLEQLLPSYRQRYFLRNRSRLHVRFADLLLFAMVQPQKDATDS